MNYTQKKAIINGSILSFAIAVLASVLKAGVCSGCFKIYLTFGGPTFSLLAFLAANIVVIPIMYIALLVNKREDVGEDTFTAPDSTNSIINFFSRYRDTILLVIVFSFSAYLIWWAFATFFGDRTYGTPVENDIDAYYEEVAL